jgi:hypothetical protein
VTVRWQASNGPPPIDAPALIKALVASQIPKLLNQKSDPHRRQTQLVTRGATTGIRYHLTFVTEQDIESIKQIQDSIERYSIRPERQKHVHHTLSFCIAHFHRSNTCRHKMVSSRRKQAVGSFFAKSYLPTRHKHPSVRQMFSQNLHYSQLYTRTPREVHARFARRQVTWSQNT